MESGSDEVVDGGRSEMLPPRRHQYDLDPSPFDLIEKLQRMLQRRGLSLSHPFLKRSQVKLLSPIDERMVPKDHSGGDSKLLHRKLLHKEAIFRVRVIARSELMDVEE